MTSPASKVSDSPLALTLGGSAVVSSTAGQPVKNKRLSIEAEWTGTPVGVFKLQRSFTGGRSWKDVPRAAPEFVESPNAQPAGGVGSATWIFINVPGGMWRITYTGTSGAGDATIAFAWGP